MVFPRRVDWLEGRHANVDGIPFEMPVRTKTSPVLFALFTIDGNRAQDLLPGEELHAWQARGRGLLLVAVVDYQDTTIGRYVEFCIGVLATHGPNPVGRVGPIVRRKRHGTGIYIHDLPVSTEISVKGGIGIWGMPKRQANLDFTIGRDTVSSQYDLDGQLVARIDIPRPRRAWFPARLSAAGWGAASRGLLMKSYIYSQGKVGFHLRPRKARLVLGDHPRAEVLRGLDIEPRPLLTGFMPHMNGVLDDHVESWYLTSPDPTPPAAATLHDIVDLSLGQEWLAPPDRERSDQLLRAVGGDVRRLVQGPLP
jgi:hypothetical protein